MMITNKLTEQEKKIILSLLGLFNEQEQVVLYKRNGAVDEKWITLVDETMPRYVRLCFRYTDTLFSGLRAGKKYIIKELLK